MGYRSEVEAVLCHRDPNGVSGRAWYAEVLARPDFTDFLRALRLERYRGVVVLRLSGGSWKWYPDYPDVMAFHALMAEVVDLGGAYKFIRLGEESDDTVEEAAGEDDILYDGIELAYAIEAQRSVRIADMEALEDLDASESTNEKED